MTFFLIKKHPSKMLKSTSETRIKKNTTMRICSNAKIQYPAISFFTDDLTHFI